MAEAVRFNPVEIRKVREEARRAIAPTGTDPAADGVFSRSDEPMKILKAFPMFSLKTGYVLRGYRLFSGGNGNGVVWAMPEEAPFPSREELRRRHGVPREKDGLAKLCQLKPTHALDDFMEIVRGDGSPWSYLCASVLARELQEYGAMWHGCWWGAHEIMGMGENDAYEPPHWTWLAEKLQDFRPAVEVAGEGAIVTLYTLSDLGQQTISRFTDRYAKDSYCFETHAQTVATGGPGVIF